MAISLYTRKQQFVLDSYSHFTFSCPTFTLKHLPSLAPPHRQKVVDSTEILCVYIFLDLLIEMPKFLRGRNLHLYQKRLDQFIEHEEILAVNLMSSSPSGIVYSMGSVSNILIASSLQQET